MQLDAQELRRAAILEQPVIGKILTHSEAESYSSVTEQRVKRRPI